jgi:hypothetical protein
MKKYLLSLILTVLMVGTLSSQTRFERQIQKTGTVDGVDESSDDAEQQNQEMDKLFDDDLDMGWEGDDFNIMTTGLRFTDIQIPQGAKIDSAYLIIYSHEEEKDTAKVTIYGEAADNSVTFSMDNLILDRPKTTSKLYWEVTEVWPIWTMFKTPDFAPIIQEIVDRQGWTSGNALALMLTGQDQGASDKDNARDFMSFENEEDPDDGGDGKNHPERVPRLVVVYKTPSSSINTIESSSFDVFPNPIDNSFRVTRKLDENTTVGIFNVSGQLVKEFTSNLTEFSVYDLNPGMYILKGTRNGYTYTKNIIVK